MFKHCTCAHICRQRVLWGLCVFQMSDHIYRINNCRHGPPLTTSWNTRVPVFHLNDSTTMQASLGCRCQTFTDVSRLYIRGSWQQLSSCANRGTFPRILSFYSLKVHIIKPRCICLFVSMCVCMWQTGFGSAVCMREHSYWSSPLSLIFARHRKVFYILNSVSI